MISGIQPVFVVLPFSACVFRLVIQGCCLFSSHHIYIPANMEGERKKDILFPLKDTSQVRDTWFRISRLNLGLNGDSHLQVGLENTVSQVASTLKCPFIEEEVVVGIYGQQRSLLSFESSDSVFD